MVEATPTQAGSSRYWRESPYDRWIASTGLPVHHGYYIKDLRTVEKAWWEERQCYAAILQLVGQEKICEGRVTEIPPGKTMPPLRFALDELVYVVAGRGITSIWAAEGKPKKTFEWQAHSMFRLPRNYFHQFTNVQGNEPVTLLHYNYLPVAMSATPEPEFFFDNLGLNPDERNGQLGDDIYSEAISVFTESQGGQYVTDNPRGSVVWRGNFFPDMTAWDKLTFGTNRGAAVGSMAIQFPGSPHTCHMTVFPSRTYRKAHRHGAGFIILIPKGEGYSVMWEEGGERVVIPWHEASIFFPPYRWFHQHFNVGTGVTARYFAFHPPAAFAEYQSALREEDQIEFPDEDPWIRQTFEEELAKRNVESLMPKEIYTNRDYKWTAAKEE